MSTRLPIVALPTLDELRRYVHRKLCEQDRLDPTQTPLKESVIRRSGQPCGLFFQVLGPRLLRSYAIWAGNEDRILFYASCGSRAGEAALSEAPDPGACAA
jgi:hypothetical protein